ILTTTKCASRCPRTTSSRTAGPAASRCTGRRAVATATTTEQLFSAIKVRLDAGLFLLLGEIELQGALVDEVLARRIRHLHAAAAQPHDDALEARGRQPHRQ